MYFSPKSAVAGVCARFAWEQVRDGVVLWRAEWATDRAVDGCTDEIVVLIGATFRGLRRISAVAKGAERVLFCLSRAWADVSFSSRESADFRSQPTGVQTEITCNP
jgi:hypothetical protein